MKQGSLKTFLVLILFAILSASGIAQLKYHRIEAAISKEQFTILMKAGLSIDHYEYKNGILRADVSDDDIKLMKNRKVSVKFILADIEKNLEAFNKRIDKSSGTEPISNARTVPTPSHFGTGGSYGTAGGVAKHFTFQEMQNELDEMRAAYPGLITIKQSIGSTEQGRALYMVRISDNADTDENEPEVFLNAVHHAREPISMTQLIFFMWHVLENYNTDKEIQTLINSSEMYIVPCVNPDGYVYNINANPAGGSMWRKNRHNNGNGTYGVDNNRNYGFRWGGAGSSGSTTSETYRGSAPFSELENQAIRNFCNARNFVTEFNYHAHGNYLIYPFSSVAVNDNPEVPLFRQLSVFLTEDNSFVYGNCQETLNYIADGEAADWAYGEQTTKGKMYGFTPEIGNSSDGFYPAASRILPLCNSMTVMNLNLLKVSSFYGLVSANAPATVSSLNNSIPFSLKNHSLYPATYTIGLTSSSTFVTGIDAPRIIPGTTIFQSINDQFNFTLSPLITDGTVLNFVLSTNNGYHTRYDDITIVYHCTAPGSTSISGITTTSANVSWGAISGVTNYYLSMKPSLVSTWGADVTVSGTSSTFTGLTPGTGYNWRVRAEGCTYYSPAQSFTTLTLCSTPSTSASNITSTGFTLTWPAVPGASSYNVQTRLQGSGTWTTSTVATNSKVVTGLLPFRTYEFQVRTNCSSGSSPYSGIQSVTTTYCPSNGGNTNEWIDYIQLRSITRSSGKETGGYINTGLSTNLARNKKHTITFSAGFTSTAIREYWNVYIDYNNDGDFSDGNEHEVSVNKTGSGNYSATFSVPNNALLSTARMRVIMSRTSTSSPCGTFTNGEVEEYTVNITASAGEEEGDEAARLPGNANDVNSVNDVSKPGIKVTPNPFTDEVKITLPGLTTKHTSIILSNVLGEVLYKQRIGMGVSKHTINTSHLPAGMYFLLIENDNGRSVMKVVK